MKTIANLLNGFTSQSFCSAYLRNSFFAFGLLVTMPAFALDGKGWGQHLQLADNGSGSGQNCLETISDVSLVKWSGGCVNGQLSGDGEFLAYRVSQKKLIKTVAKMQNGFYVGITLTHDLEKDGITITDIMNERLFFYESGNAHLLPLVVKINNRLQNYVYKDFDWYKLAADNKHLDRQVSFDEAMEIVKNYMAIKNSDSMSYERFRAYLEGKLSFDPSQTVTQQTSTSTASASEADDEPPQKGIFLDRRKKSTTKKKK